MSIAENLENILASGKDDAILRFGLGSAYFNTRDYDQAIPHLRACLGHDPEYTAAYKLLGKALFKTGRHSDARAVFESGLPVAIEKGDKQTEKEISVFLKKLDKQEDG